MSQEITLDGAIYVSSKRAAEISGYAQDYVGQLARGGKIDARRVSGLWYIKQDSLLEHKEKAEAYVPTPPQMQSKTHASRTEDNESFMMDGKTYVSASRASELTRYHQDYIGQLAREEIISSRQVGNRWFVDIEELKTHKKEKDALLAEVQAESVGIRKVTDAGYDTPENSPEKDYKPHFNYSTEAPSPDPFIEKDDISDERASEISENDEPSVAYSHEDPDVTAEAPESTAIPIRVVHEARIVRSRAEEPDPQRTWGGVHIPKKILVIGAAALVFLLVLTMNFEMLKERFSSNGSKEDDNSAISKGFFTGGLFTRDIYYQRAR